MDESTLKSILTSLETSRSSLHSSLRFWEWMVVAGVVVELFVVAKEYWDDLREFRRGTIHSPEKPSTLLLALGLLGAGLVAVGIAKELSIDSEIEGVETQIRGVNERLFGIVSQEADSASLASSSAQQKVGEVTKQANALATRMEAASRKLGELGQDILAIGPRWRLLKNGETTFVEALKPFAGQRVTVVICGQDDPERWALEQTLLNSFRKAGWDNPGYARWDGCGVMLSGGIEIVFASPGTDFGNQWVESYFCLPSKEPIDSAATALCNVLNKLKISTHALREKRSQDEQERMRARMFFGMGLPGSPGEMALEDPTTIYVLVAPNQPKFEQKRPHKSRPTK